MNKDKLILIAVENGFAARNFLRSDFLNLLSNSFGKVVVLVPVSKLEYFKKNYSHDNVIFDVMSEERNSKFQRAVFKVLKYSIYSETNRIKLLKTLFKREGGINFGKDLLFFPFLISCWYLSKFIWWRALMRKIYQFTKIDKECAKIIDRYRPNLVFANYTPISISNFNLKLIRAAKNEKVITVGNILSWDNLYSKVFISEHTDFLTVPNLIIKDLAVRIGDFDEKKINIVGLPGFDTYFKKETLMQREDFFKKIKADPNKKLILFALAGRDLISEEGFLNFFDNLKNNGFKDAQIYVRPYPKAILPKELIEKFKDNNNLIFEDRRDYMDGQHFEFSKNDDWLLPNLLRHSDLLINFYSTIMTEACLFNVPVVNVSYSRGLKNNYYHSVERWPQLDHMKQILKNNCARGANNDSDLLMGIKEYLNNPGMDSEGRAKTAKEHLFYLDGLSAQRLCDFLKRVS